MPQRSPIHRPRVRGQRGETKLGSYELFRQEEAMHRQVWDRILRGLVVLDSDNRIPKSDSP
jgi:hypothetical protein